MNDDQRSLFFKSLSASSGVGAITVSIPQDVYEFARGDNITLPFTSTVLSMRRNKKIRQFFFLFLCSCDALVITDISAIYEGRASLDVNVLEGKANLKLSSIKLADNKQFECRVLIPTDEDGQPADTARLVVLVAPSTPICSIQGTAEYGQNINLTCKSEEGSPPPTYKWESRDVKNMPQGGILSLYNISVDTSGYYKCTSANKIRSASCNITLSVMPPSMNIGSTAGIIGGVVAALLILIILIYCCCCRKKNKEKEEYAMG
uniref:Ig-like domain-containing protein n=1 Tax=Mola mola TaxID=94237 RepID=A0A3Q3X0X5_MOLML